MIHQSFFKAILFALSVTLLVPACKKNDGNGGGGGGGNNSNVMYPATLSFYEGNNGAYPSVSTFKYDDKHHLTYKGNAQRYTGISGSQVLTTIVTSATDTLFLINIFSGDIFTGNGVTLVKSNNVNRSPSGSTTSPVITYPIGVGGAPDYTLGSYSGGTFTHFFTYDNNGNITSSKIVTNAVGAPGSSSYDPGGLEYDRLTYKGYDTKPSPYSAMPGYRFIAYLWSYPQEFTFAFSKHNPSQIIEESLNPVSNQWQVYSQTDFTYTYNDQGYPSEVKVKTVYPSTATPNQAFYQTYDFTYSK